jgi:hypothetical protein
MTSSETIALLLQAAFCVWDPGTFIEHLIMRPVMLQAPYAVLIWVLPEPKDHKNGCGVK